MYISRSYVPPGHHRQHDELGAPGQIKQAPRGGSDLVHDIMRSSSPSGNHASEDNSIPLLPLFSYRLSQAISHARVTAVNHFRADNSTYHLVAYSQITGGVLFQGTFQVGSLDVR